MAKEEKDDSIKDESISKPTGGYAIKLMQQIAQGIYDSTPGIQEEMPRNISKILQDVKNDKKKDLLSQIAGKDGVPDQTNELRYEDWQSKYKEILEEYRREKTKTQDMVESLHENQMRYIKREQEYKDVISNIETKI